MVLARIALARIPAHATASPDRAPNSADDVARATLHARHASELRRLLHAREGSGCKETEAA